MCFLKFLHYFIVALICLIPATISSTNSQECKTNLECDMEKSVCVKGKCVCPGGHVMTGDMTKCLMGAEGFRKPCEESVQCSYALDSGGQCINKTCQCAEGYHYLRGSCWKTRGLGEECAHDENCYVNYDFESTSCSSEKICVCAKGYYQREYSSCRRKAERGESCGIDLDCQFPNAVCTKDRKCADKNDKAALNKLSELPEIGPGNVLTGQLNSRVGDTCKYDSDCKEIKNSMCNAAGKCACRGGFYSNDEKTICFAEVGSQCTTDEDCSGKNMMCRKEKGWCTCKAGFVSSEDNKFCDKMSRDLNWSCLTDRWCSLFGPGGVCVDRECQCSTFYHFVKEEFYCWKTKMVGDKCKQEPDCGSDASSETCENGKCLCRKGFHSSSDGFSCRKDSEKPGEPCIEDVDCVYPHGMCNKNVCSCGKGYVSAEDKCLVGIHGECNEKETCSVKDSSCLNGICECNKGTVVSTNLSKCLPEAEKYEDNCEESVQCSKLLDKGGDCVNGSCICTKGYHFFREGFPCFETRLIGQRCHRDAECIVNTSCINRNCRCTPPLITFNFTCLSGAEGIMSSKFFVLMTSVTVILNISLSKINLCRS